MVSQDSNVNSEGVPIDHFGEPLEGGIVGGRSSSSEYYDKNVEIRPGFAVVVNADGSTSYRPLTPTEVRVVPDEDLVVVEDCDSEASNDTITPEEATKVCLATVDPAIQAAFASNKNEREELIRMRKQMNVMSSFLLSKGLKWEDCFNEAKSTALQRDEHGLPLLNNAQSFETAGPRGAKDVETAGPSGVKDVNGVEIAPYLDTMAATTKVFEKSPMKQDLGTETNGEKPKSWASMLKQEVPKAKFTFIPSAKGADVVRPPVEVLKKGNEKLRHCVVGTFTKGTSTYKNVSDFAFKVWGPRGLVGVFKKDPNTFIFKFKGEFGMNAALSRGTWYINKRPMIVTAWGIKPGATPVTSMPIWVKLTNVPDGYWTEEGLSSLASFIGQPRGADNHTSKLQVMPFAMLQVQYELGDPLPNEIKAATLHPVTNEESIEIVNVTYPERPMVCFGCKSLGHSVGACPITKREWKLKTPEVINVVNDVVAENQEKIDTQEIDTQEVQDGKKMDGLEEIRQHPNVVEEVANDQNWSTIKRKHLATPLSGDEESPPIKTFPNLKNVDEIESKKQALNFKYDTGGSSSGKKLSKSQRKRLRQSKGASPSRSS